MQPCRGHRRSRKRTRVFLTQLVSCKSECRKLLGSTTTDRETRSTPVSLHITTFSPPSVFSAAAGEPRDPETAIYLKKHLFEKTIYFSEWPVPVFRNDPGDFLEPPGSFPAKPISFLDKTVSLTSFPKAPVSLRENQFFPETLSFFWKPNFPETPGVTETYVLMYA